LDDHAKQLIKSISSANIRASHADDNIDELKHLIFAAHDITDLFLLCFDGRIDVTCAKSYSVSFVDIANRIGELVGELQ